ncbi:response regulator transcription factor [Brevundimonas sp.]|jgi:two-component system response regulator QseB|uniref:response regulator transcription factor n=1 Tax=Brevundimonas sp. TaxID=1871086 RepID=UPI0037C06FDB
MRILLIEDNRLLAKSTARSLTASRFTVDVLHTVADAWEAWNTTPYDAVVLDLMLGEDHGLDLLSQARRAALTTPVLVLTALGEIDDRVRGLDRGADDYLVKPFAIDELIARLRALGRRPEHLVDAILTLGSIQYDVAAQMLSGPKGQVHLSRAESMVIERFFRRSERVISKAQLGEALHPLEGHYSENSLHILLHRVRRRLAGVGGDVSIQALRGMGYIATVAP